VSSFKKGGYQTFAAVYTKFGFADFAAIQQICSGVRFERLVEFKGSIAKL
jgi:hypothetical protein